MTVELITDHEAAAVARLASQFKEQDRIDGLVRALVAYFQHAEDTLDDFFNFMSITTAIGAQLDLLGAIVGEGRRGRNDNDYRKAIVARIGINTSKGTPEEAISIFKFMTEAGRVFLIETFPAEVEMYADVDIEYQLLGDGEEAFAMDGGIDGLGFGDVFDPTVGGGMAYLQANDIIAIYLILESVLPAGVRLNYIGWFDGEEAFSFEGDTDGLGFGDALDSTVGGKFAKLVPIGIDFSFASDTRRTRGFGDVGDPLLGGEFVSA